MLYVDDSGIAAPTTQIIDDLIKGLEDLGLQLTREGSFAEFLGIKFENSTDGSIELTQKGLINKILEATKKASSNPNKTPTTQLALPSDPDGPPMTETWSYPSVVGMLLYLTTNTRPDIAFAVSQVARFNSAPKQSHATAVKMSILIALVSSLLVTTVSDSFRNRGKKVKLQEKLDYVQGK